MLPVRGILIALIVWATSASVPAGTPGIANPQTPIESITAAPAIGHAFNDVAFEANPDNLESLGYSESEYIFSGHASVYGFMANRPNTSIERLGIAPYTDRMLIRRPTDPSRFSGNVLVEIINSALSFDAVAVWPYMQRQLVRAGDIWVGITATPVAIHSLRLANPQRYATLDFGPNPDNTCHSTNPETGTIFDILTQTSQLLRQTDNPLNPLRGLKVQALIATGYSQGALILATYTNAIAPNVDGPTFDGYLSIAGLGGYALNNCERLADFVTRILAPVSNGIPLMQIQTTSETVLLPLGMPGESQHDKSIDAPYRYYDLAGSGHLDGILASHAPNAADLQAAGGYDLPSAIDGCHLAYPVSQFPIYYVYDNLLARMKAWIRQGQPPPPSQRFLLGGWLWPGHVLGGVRSPAVDVPVADYFLGVGVPVETTSGGFTSGVPCLFASIQNNYSHSRLKSMYGNHQNYLDRVKLSVRQLLQTGFLTADDAVEIVSQAAAAAIP